MSLLSHVFDEHGRPLEAGLEFEDFLDAMIGVMHAEALPDVRLESACQPHTPC